MEIHLTRQEGHDAMSCCVSTKEDLRGRTEKISPWAENTLPGFLAGTVEWVRDYERSPSSQFWVNAPVEGRQRPSLDYLVWMLYLNLAGHGWEKWRAKE